MGAGGRTGQGCGPKSPAVEARSAEWFQGVAGEAERALGRRMQEAAYRDVPFMPTGIFFQATAHRRTLVDLPKMFAQFYGVRNG